MDIKKLDSWYKSLHYKTSEERFRLLRLKKTQDLIDPNQVSRIFTQLENLLKEEQISIHAKLKDRHKDFCTWFDSCVKTSDNYSFLTDLHKRYAATDLLQFKKLIETYYPDVEIILVGQVELIRCEFAN